MRISAERIEWPIRAYDYFPSAVDVLETDVHWRIELAFWGFSVRHLAGNISSNVLGEIVAAHLARPLNAP